MHHFLGKDRALVFPWPTQEACQKRWRVQTRLLHSVRVLAVHTEGLHSVRALAVHTEALHSASAKLAGVLLWTSR